MKNPAEAERSYLSVYNNDDVGTGHARSMLDSVQAWSAAAYAVKSQWMQIDLGTLMSVTGVITQGRQDRDQWVTGYTISTSTDGNTWTPVNRGQTFRGNTDSGSKVNHVFSPVSARSVRLYVKTWHSYISMRAGVITSGITHHDHEQCISCMSKLHTCVQHTLYCQGCDAMPMDQDGCACTDVGLSP